MAVLACQSPPTSAPPPREQAVERDTASESEPESRSESELESETLEPEPEPPAPPSEEETLRAQVTALAALLEGRLPQDEALEPRTLFEVDLNDNAAVQARLRTLRGHSHIGTHDAGPHDAGPHEGGPRDAAADGTAPDGTPMDAALFDASRDGAIETGAAAATIATPNEPLDAGLPAADAQTADAQTSDGAVADGALADGAVAAPAQAPDAGRPIAEPLDELERLRRERDALRLRFLELPEDDRRALLQTVEHAFELDRQGQAAAAASNEAQSAVEAAELARAQAADEARQARGVAERTEAEARVELQSFRAELAEVVRRSADSRQNELTRQRSRLELVHRVRTSLRGELSESEAAESYDAVVESVVAARAALRGSFRSANLPTMPRAPSSLDEEVLSASEALAEAQETLESLRVEQIEALADEVSASNELRLTLLDRLSPARREALLGFGEMGRSQLKRELEQVAVMALYGAERTIDHLLVAPQTAWSLALDPQWRSRLLGVMLLLGLAVWAWRRRRELLRSTEEALWRRFKNQRARARFVPWWRRLESILPALWLAVSASAIAEMAAPLSDSHLVPLLRNGVIAIALYRGCVALVTREISPNVRLAIAIDPADVPVTRDVRFAGRYALTAVILLSIANTIVGRGTLFAYLSRVLVLTTLIAAGVLINRWRDQIARAYRDRHPEGRLAIALDRKGAAGFVVSVAAAGQVFVEWLLEQSRTALVRFSAGRRAVEILRRRRSEVPADVERELPAEVEAACALNAESPTLTEVFPKLDDVASRIHEHGTAVLVVGELGSGKTTYLDRLAERASQNASNVIRVSIAPGSESAERVCQQLSEALGVRRESDPIALAHALDEADASAVVLIDEAQNLFLRCVGGTDGFRALSDIIGLTQGRLSWACAISEHAWKYLLASMGKDSAFGEVIRVGHWSAEDVTRLVEDRMANTGITLSFEDLLEGAPAGAARHRALVRSRDEYFRLLTDYTEGNPRLVLHFWLSSLRVEHGGEIRVRLFGAPDASALDELHDQTRFALASVVIHQALDPSELARTLRIPRARAASLLATLSARGMLVDDQRRAYRVSPQWQRAIFRHLKRRRLLSA